jgi:hypothetical protein
MNRNLDELERGWRQSGDLEDDVRYLLAMIGTGILDHGRIQMAASLGHLAARATGAVVAPLPAHYRSKVKAAALVLSHNEAISFALDCAIRVLHAWESIHSDDTRPRKALQATRSWLIGQVTGEAAERAALEAANAGVEASDPNEVAPHPSVIAARYAADAASHAALAADFATKLAEGQDDYTDAVADCAAYSARFAASAAPDPDMERDWQVKQLANYVLKRAEPLWTTWDG